MSCLYPPLRWGWPARVWIGGLSSTLLFASATPAEHLHHLRFVLELDNYSLIINIPKRVP